MKQLKRSMIITGTLTGILMLLMSTSGFAKEYAPKWCLSSQLAAC